MESARSFLDCLVNALQTVVFHSPEECRVRDADEQASERGDQGEEHKPEKGKWIIAGSNKETVEELFRDRDNRMENVNCRTDAYAKDGRAQYEAVISMSIVGKLFEGGGKGFNRSSNLANLGTHELARTFLLVSAGCATTRQQ